TQGGRFGDRYIPTTSRHGDLAVYAAKRSDGATTIAVINKSLGGACDLSLEATGLKGKLQIWRFDSASNQVIEVPTETNTINGHLSLRIPSASASMLIVK
ncbi:MAG: hypothetical protein K8T89_05900, partial [Planctomycetes bacterium]|nr:hypothetical protein [Planctomycetota bacterium]